MYEEKFSKAHRLHPLTIIVDIFMAFKESIYLLIIGVVVILRDSVLAFLLGLLVLFLLFALISFLSWYRFTYYVHDGELRIERGIFVREKRFISFHRIHKMDITANIFHRLLGITALQIDTASGNEDSQVQLNALSKREAEYLRDFIQAGKKGSVSIVDEPSTYKSRNETDTITWKRLILSGSTSTNIGFVLFGFLILFTQIEDLLPENLFEQTFEYILSISIVFLFFLIIGCLIVLWVISIFIVLVKYAYFTIEKRPDELFITRGLLEKKQLTIPFERIQAVGLEQNMLHQLLGYVKVYAVIAGGSFDKMETFPVLFPFMKKEEVPHFIQRFVDDYPVTLQENGPYVPKYSWRFFMTKLVILPIILLLLSIFFFPTYSWVAILLLLLVLLYSILPYKDMMIEQSMNDVLLQTRSMFNRVTVVTKKRNIQSLLIQDQPFQRKKGIVTVRVSLIGTNGIGTHYKIKHIDKELAYSLAEWFSYREKKDTKEGEV